MANIKSSKKDMRRIKRRYERNMAHRSRLRTYDKKIKALIAEGNTEEAQDEFRIYSAYLDRAGKTNLIHHRQADRRKSRMAQFINKSTKS